MKAVILAGGFGTRISEESVLKPKPMIEIGGKPILWHILKLYSATGINDFVICLGYKGYVIKEYFANYFLHTSNVTFDIEHNTMKVHENTAEPWRVTLVDTGDQSMTGGRLKRAAPYIGNEDFCMTYGDGVSDVDIRSLIAFHFRQKALATVTAVQPQGRYGALRIRGDEEGGPVDEFEEKPLGDGAWVNGGFFVLSPKVLEYIDGDEAVWEKGPIAGLVRDHQVSAFKHEGFWHAMDTMRDKAHLEALWASGNPPWKTWK
jgi:glucose-1-phosphate cytidylyltransferase